MNNFLRQIWHFITSDRGLAYVAIVVGVFGIWRAERLFDKLYKREQYIKHAILEQANNILSSYTAFSRAMQAVELGPTDLSRDGAFAMMTVFWLQGLLYPNATKEQLSALQKKTRNQAEDSARGYAEMFIASGQGAMRPNFKFNEPKKG